MVEKSILKSMKLYSDAMLEAPKDEGFKKRQQVREVIIKMLEEEAAEDLFNTGIRIYEEKMKETESWS